MNPVMVVDDNDDVRDAMRGLLEDEGYTVIPAANGREALDLLAEGARPSLILLDLMMPVMDGWQVLEALRQDAELSRLPVVVVTAGRDLAVDSPNVRRCLRKPLHFEALLDAVSAYSAEPSAG